MASMYELEGTVKTILDLQTFPSGFTKREFVVTTEERFPQDIKIECVKERTSLLDGVAENDRVKVTFFIRGNEYNGRYYVNLQAWKIDRAAVPAASGDQPPAEVDEANAAAHTDSQPEDEPF